MPGSRVDIRRTNDGQIVIEPVGAKPERKFAQLRGHAGEGMATEEIMALTRGEQ